MLPRAWTKQQKADIHSEVKAAAKRNPYFFHSLPQRTGIPRYYSDKLRLFTSKRFGTVLIKVCGVLHRSAETRASTGQE